MDNTKTKENTFLLIILTGLIFSLFNNFYQIEKFDNFNNSSKITERHSMITGDIEDFWREGDQIVQEMKNGKSYFESGGEYRRPYLPSRIIGLFSFLSSENLLSEDGKVSLGNKKILLLIIQSLTYYILLFFL